MAEYVGVVIMLALVVVTACVVFLCRGRVPRSPSSDLAGAPAPVASPGGRTTVGFFLAAIFFLILQLAGVALFGWAMSLYPLGESGFVAAVAFSLPVVLGVAYAWIRGVL